MTKRVLIGLLAVAALAPAPILAQQRVTPLRSAVEVRAQDDPFARELDTPVRRVQGGPEAPAPADPLVLGVAMQEERRRAPVSRYRLIGALAGAAIGVAGYYFTGYQSDDCRDPDMFPCEPGFVVFAIGGGAVGAIAGHFVGKAANRP